MTKSIQLIAIGLAAVLGSIWQVDTAVGQTALIDQEMLEGIDLRASEYRVCVDESVCSVNGILIRAERRDEVTGEWAPALIYWDPVDGIGVKDGGQNDEIDFDERVVVKLFQGARVEKVWFSDLFHGENARYGANQTPRSGNLPEDAEVAAVDVSSNGEVVETLVVAGATRLPQNPFNDAISTEFRERGDLRRRVVINDDIITLVVPYQNRRGNIVMEMPFGQGDPEKLALFEGLQTVEIDLTPILAEFHNAPLFAVGTTNADRIETWLNDPARLAEIRARAERERLANQVSNGETVVELRNADYVDSFSFYAPFDASNDFSVVGFVLAQE